MQVPVQAPAVVRNQRSWARGSGGRRRLDGDAVRPSQYDEAEDEGAEDDGGGGDDAGADGDDSVISD